MSKFYSKTTNGFYDSSINASMPTDAVAVTDSAYQALFAAQAAGQIIQSNANGNPEAVSPPAPSAAQVAVVAGMAALNTGIAITSTGTPAINGIYALTSNTLLMVTGAVSYCQLKGQFPGNSSTLTFFDAAGAPHVFSSVTEFELFAEAIASYVNPIQDYINSGGTQGSLPTSNAVTIA